MDNLRLGPIGQIARPVRDVARSARWYGEVLGLPHLYTYGDLAFFDCGGTRLMLSLPEGGDSEGGDTAGGNTGGANTATGQPSVLYFRVEDIHAAHGELRARGVEFVDDPHMIFRHPSGTEEWMAFFTDPDGCLLAIMSQVPA